MEDDGAEQALMMQILGGQAADLLYDEDEAPALRRRQRPRVPWEDTAWMRMLAHDNMQDDDSIEACSFRLRFRVPYPLFLHLVEITRAAGILACGDTDAAGRPAAPLELKILAILRILGRGVKFDDAAELSGLSLPTVARVMHEWTSGFAQQQYHNWVQMPRTAAELSNVMAAYRAIGLPGAIGSVDVTHIHLGRTPEQLRFELTGKEGYATYGYQAVVAHDGRLLAACGGFHGATNDKTIVRMDPAIIAGRDEMPFINVQYELLDADGVPFTVTGAWFLCDGGYHKVSGIVCHPAVLSASGCPGLII